jgi:hypothetical protein
MTSMTSHKPSGWEQLADNKVEHLRMLLARVHEKPPSRFYNLMKRIGALLHFPTRTECVVERIEGARTDTEAA